MAAAAGSDFWGNRRWLWLLSAAFAAAIAIQLAALSWVALGPIGPFGRVQAAKTGQPAPSLDWAVFSRFDPFFRTLGPSNPVIAQSGAELGLTLFAVRREARGGGGAAIVAGVDGRQIAVQIGEEVVPGVKLHAVQDDGAVFQRGGELLEVKFPAGTGPGSGGLLRPAGPIGYKIDPKRFFAEVRLLPLGNGDSLRGFTVAPGSSPERLSEAGLQVGDVVLSLNGVALSSLTAVQTAAGSLAGRLESVITYERQGKSESVTVRVVAP